MTSFGTHLRTRREALRRDDPSYSLRRVAQRIGIEPAYLSKIEREVFAPPSEAVILKLAVELGEHPDVLLAMAGKLSTTLRNIILERPQLFADLLHQLEHAPDAALLRVVRQVRDGDW